MLVCKKYCRRRINVRYKWLFLLILFATYDIICSLTAGDNFGKNGGFKMRRGKFIVFEGIDGSGKTTVINSVYSSLTEEGCCIYSQESRPIIMSAA